MTKGGHNNEARNKPNTIQFSEAAVQASAALPCRTAVQPPHC